MTFPDSAAAPAPASDHDLVDRARNGEQDALEQLMVRHRRGAYFLALQLLGNPDDAMDATQDSLIRFMSSLARFTASRPVRPWLYTSVRNRCRDLMRRRRVRKWVPLEIDEGFERPELVSHDASPHDDAVHDELRSRVWEALSHLGQEHREIVVLRDYQDLSYDEIAATLSIPRGTVMSRLHRARKKLALLLAGERPTGPREDTP